MSRRRGLEGIGNVARSLLDFLEDLAAKTPEQSEAIAEGVLALRDQGLARYVTDDMMAKADDKYMFANTPLPMDEASRMDRASEMGFDPRTFYHGSDFGYFDDFYDATDYSLNVIDKGKGTIFASDNPAVANTYVDYLMNERGMYPLMVRRTYTEPTFAGGGRSWAQLPMDMPEYRSGSLKDYFPETKPNMPIFTRTSTDNIAAAMSKTPYQTTEITDVLDRGGFDLRALPVPEDKDVRLRMSKEDTDAAETWVKEMQAQSREPSTDMLVQQANRIRSRFARFDPEFKHLRNLSAAVPLSVGLAQLLNDPQSTKEDVEKYLEAINGEM